MKLSLSPGSVTTFLSLAGTGAAYAMPEQKWLGFLLMACAGASLFANVRIERSELRLGGKRMHWTHYLVAVCGIAFCLSLVLMSFYSEPRKQTASGPQIIYTPLDLFMADIRDAMKNSGDVNSAIHADTYFTVPGQKGSVHLYYAVIMHVNQNSKYMSFYIPYSEASYNILLSIPGSYKKLMNDAEKNSVGYGGPDFHGVVRPSDLNFSGRIFVYCGNPLSLQQLAAADRLFTESGASLRYRDDNYSLSVREAVNKGVLLKPDRYKIGANGLPEIAEKQ